MILGLLMVWGWVLARKTTARRRPWFLLIPLTYFAHSFRHLDLPTDRDHVAKVLDTHDSERETALRLT
jgi:hypothetical protein